MDRNEQMQNFRDQIAPKADFRNPGAKTSLNKVEGPGENNCGDSTRQLIKEKDRLAIKEVKTRRGLSCKFAKVAPDIKAGT